ncbi:hypothetical protein [Herbaspirillum sp. NPDC087042]
MKWIGASLKKDALRHTDAEKYHGCHVIAALLATASMAVFPVQAH